MEITELIHELEETHPEIAERLKEARDDLVHELYKKSRKANRGDSAYQEYRDGVSAGLKEAADYLRG